MYHPARIGDPVTHDFLTYCGTIAPSPAGIPTVIIEGRPAATAGALVVCSGATAAGPLHPPTPASIPGGSTSIVICGMPALRWFPAPDLTPCGAALGDPRLSVTRTVVMGGA